MTQREYIFDRFTIEYQLLLHGSNANLISITGLKEQKKKRFIAVLLLVSCFISGYMLFQTSEGGTKHLRSLAQADSLIQKKLSDFNIGEHQIRTTNTRAGSSLTRKTYHVGLPYGVSKTQLHAELNNIFYDYSISTPAKVTFPEQSVDIHLLSHGTVIRTISLYTDPDLSMPSNSISILFSFDEFPDQETISDITSLGEPIPIVVKIQTPMQANEFKKQQGQDYDRILFWLQDREGEDLLTNKPREALDKLRQLEKILPEAQILQLRNSQKIQRQLTSKTNLTFVNINDALLLNEEMGKAVFNEKLHSLLNNTSYSATIISGNETTLSWLKQKLPELKKAGIQLIPPSQTNY